MLQVLLACLDRHGIALDGAALREALQWSADYAIKIRLYTDHTAVHTPDDQDELSVYTRDGRLLRQIGSACYDCGWTQNDNYVVLEAHAWLDKALHMALDACWEP